MSRHLGSTLGPTSGPSEAPDVRAMERAFAEWISSTHRNLPAEDVRVRLLGLRRSRRDLLRRRGERRPDRVLTSLAVTDIGLLLAQSRHEAEWWGSERVAEVQASCRSWLEYVQFLVDSDGWEGERGAVDLVRAELRRHLGVGRGELLASGSHAARSSFPFELAQLRRTRLVQEAEDVLRGRSRGTARLRSQLRRLGFLCEDGHRGARWSSWASAAEVDAGCARRRLVVAEVVRVLRVLDDDVARALALVTSVHPGDVADGARRLEDLVVRGVLDELVEAGVLPVRGPWRIARGLQHSVHVALSRLVDDGVLDADLRRRVLAATG